MSDFSKIPVKHWLKGIILGILTLVVVVACRNQPTVQTSQTSGSDFTAQLTELEFGVGLYFPTSGENRKQFEPLFNELARAVNLPAKVTVADDWVGISEALRSGIASARVIRTQSARHTPSHRVDNQTGRVAYECDF
jgi:phosphonate transport system substrate-binding protein